jgi:hypothetical protein
VTKQKQQFVFLFLFFHTQFALSPPPPFYHHVIITFTEKLTLTLSVLLHPPNKLLLIWSDDDWQAFRTGPDPAGGPTAVKDDSLYCTEHWCRAGVVLFCTELHCMYVVSVTARPDSQTAMTMIFFPNRECFKEEVGVCSDCSIALQYRTALHCKGQQHQRRHSTVSVSVDCYTVSSTIQLRVQNY